MSILNHIIKCNVKGVARTEEPTENYLYSIIWIYSQSLFHIKVYDIASLNQARAQDASATVSSCGNVFLLSM